MDERYQYVFRISETYSPDTMPMGRLSEYMAKLAELFGYREGVHFVDLLDQSTGLAVKVDEPIRQPVAKRLAEAPTPAAPKELRRLLFDVNEMLRADGGKGDLIRVASNDEAYGVVITLGGVHSPTPKAIGPVRQWTTIDGKLNRVGGNNRHAQIIDAENRRYNGEFPMELAQRLGGHLYHWLRFYGEGQWQRSAFGEWELLDFQIKNFEPLAREALEDIVAKLRTIEGSEWAKMEDPLSFLRDLRRDDDEVH